MNIFQGLISIKNEHHFQTKQNQLCPFLKYRIFCCQYTGSNNLRARYSKMVAKITQLFCSYKSTRLNKLFIRNEPSTYGQESESEDRVTIPNRLELPFFRTRCQIRIPTELRTENSCLLINHQHLFVLSDWNEQTRLFPTRLRRQDILFSWEHSSQLCLLW